MHVNNINIEDEDMKFAEEILLSEGQVFDDARRNYIKDFGTLDLMAVPGSGKTTLLLAKLLILEKRLPFINNRGIVVISHTNTAVNEIEERLRPFCPNLFRYPNFIGTIQGFVNKYLAFPYYEITYNKNIKNINDKRYYENIERYFKSMKDYGLKAWLNRRYEPIEFLKSIRLNENDNLIIEINGKEEDFPLKDKLSSSYKGLKRMKQTLLKNGILHYDDAYYLAMKYINTNPNIIKLLQRRFKFVFIDEMQDMDIHQYKLIEKVFSDNKEMTSFQRLGDNNQAIYSNKVSSDDIWENRDKVYTISGSNRLTKLNANLASRFSIDNSYIEGLNTVDKEYKPVLLVYDKDKVECSVIKAFSEYLNRLFEGEEKYNNINYKVICWRRYHGDQDKITLSSYCPNNKYMDGNNNNSSVLLNTNYNYDKITEIIIDRIIDKLNEANIKLNDQYMTKSLFVDYLKEAENDAYDNYKLCIYRCTQFLLNGNYAMIYEEFNAYLEKISKLISQTSGKSCMLISSENEFEFTKELEAENNKCSKCDVLGKSPIINTVHSVKGETHDVTLFLESFYNKNYESDILHEILCGRTISELIEADLRRVQELKNEIDAIKAKGKDRGVKSRKVKINGLKSNMKLKNEYAKLIYVALTRAKSVIGYGISRDKYNEYLVDNINIEEWEMIFIE